MPSANAGKPVLISDILSSTSNPTVKRMSVMSGIERKALEEKLISLKDLRKFINLSMREAESAIDDHEIGTRGYNIARSVSITSTIALAVIPMTGTTVSAVAAGTISVSSSIIGDIIAAFSGGIDESFAVKKLIQNKSQIVATIFEQAGKNTVAKGISTATTIGEIVYDLYNDNASSSVGIKSAKQSLLAQLQRLDKKIYELEDLMGQL